MLLPVFTMKVSEPSPKGEGDALLSCMRSDSAAVMKFIKTERPFCIRIHP